MARQWSEAWRFLAVQLVSCRFNTRGEAPEQGLRHAGFSRTLSSNIVSSGLHSGILYTYDCSILSIFLAFSFIDIIIQVILINAYMSACMLTFFQVTKLPSFCVFIFWPFCMSLSLFSFMPSLDWRSVAMHPVVSDDWTPFLNSTQ